ncbi:amidohydrolase family protein [Geobacter pelophilus]|uniref:Amidohydrolase family protein n=1 Tax=Geoanaerobacter pelophilus TaxID=60036 RepID=A0AAW4L540_9BACT|nr:amidohydrolase family protein [Geoanaerobacter pelophilus]MBT0666013.1 amidohydrolase family protein [Geoanaerobacter pelophilus]
MISFKDFSDLFRPLVRILNSWPMCVLAIGLSCGQVFAADATLGPEGAKTIPIADSHVHVLKWMNAKTLLENMDLNSIRWCGGAWSPKQGEASSVLGDRYIGATGQRQFVALHDNLDTASFENPTSPQVKNALSSIEEDLRDKSTRVVGEIIVNALTSTRQPSYRFKLKADSPTLKALFELASKYKRPMNIHAQWDSDTAQEVERLAASNRNGQLILSHCGSTTTPSDIRSLFERNANVSCDLSARSMPPLKGQKNAIFNDNGILGGWKKLIEDFPERFVVGLDTLENWEQYEDFLHKIRFGLLANLSPETAEKVAYKNAQALFQLK